MFLQRHVVPRAVDEAGSKPTETASAREDGAPPPADAPGIVVIGASAGGLASLQALVAGLPPDFRMPVLVAQHSDPRHASHLADILARHTTLPVHVAIDGERVKPGEIGVCPSSMAAHLAADGTVELRPIASHPPRGITALMFSAADAYGERAVAVILSGTGSDGVAGALEVKRRGGTVLVESEASAAHFGMPSAAIRAGAADIVRPATAMGEVLSALASGTLDKDSAERTEDFENILAFVQQTRGTRLDHYRTGTVRRRLRRHVFLSGYSTYAEYLAALKKDPKEIDRLFDTLLINVSSFFRDPDAFTHLRDEVIADLVERVKRGESVRVWSAGCATGEETYSLAMLFAEALPDPNDWTRVKIFATDLDAAAVDIAREGAYPRSQIGEVGSQRLAAFFTETPDGVRVTKALRRMVVFGVHDLTKDPPIANQDLIACRNVLIYFDVPLQRRVLTTLRFSLADGGCLFLGRSEAVPSESEFVPIDRRYRLFRRRGPAPLGSSADEAASAAARASRDRAGVPSPAALGTHLADFAGLILVAIDRDDRVVFANRHARDIEDSASASAEGRFAAMFPSLATPRVTEAIRESRTRARRVHVPRFECVRRGRRVILEIQVAPLEESPTDQVILVARDVTSEEEARLRVGERAVSLQGSVQDLQGANDALQAANEELETTNEELQATNEELATLNEEFQSTNEELETTNEELQSANEDLSASNTALEESKANQAWVQKVLRRVADGADEAVVVLDEKENIVLWSSQARDLFGETEAEVLGRSVYGVRLQGIAEVIRTGLLRSAADGAPFVVPEVRIQDRAGVEHHISLRIEQLMKDGSEPGGWSLTCRDLTPVRAADQGARVAAARYLAILRGTADGVLALDPDGAIRDPNPRAVELLPRSADGKLPEFIWEVTDAMRAVFEIKGAVADLARGTERTSDTHTVEVPTRDGGAVTLVFVAADATGVPPIVLVRPSRSAPTKK